MKAGKIIAGKTTQFHQANGQHISHYHLCRRTGGRRQVVGTSFFFNRRIQYPIRLPCQKTIELSGHSYQPKPIFFNQGNQGFYFRTLTALANE